MRILILTKPMIIMNLSGRGKMVDRMKVWKRIDGIISRLEWFIVIVMMLWMYKVTLLLL